MRWTTKARVQRLLSAVPGGASLYYLGQRSVGGLRDFTIASKIDQGARLMRALTVAGRTVEGCRTVEIGTGWTPILPVLLWVYGQRECDTYDVAALMKPALVRDTLIQFGQLRDRVL